MNESFSARIKKALDYRKMTAAELSRQTQISTGMLSDYINGRINPKQDKIYLIAKALNVNATWLLGYPDTEMLPEENNQEEKEEVHKITSKDIFTADGKKITGQEILDLINERIRQNKNKHK
ncbi:helix-turn-helix transcriptional regulator [Lactobacillus gasseri]|jgi:DNA-binding protein|uniref:helix-turn-helix domain-containing protein n=1 Tax=Lactobacillus gasseri TaxID=1596 RepID=UPI0022ABF086|nr:helix-turn-helix transcriptional regulator [Lactobacillus gasseri]MCT7894492.1 helix-turn-helix domain-containing protein [Lactobacillus gasseri]MCZ3760968.1 helix-turn-helix domain-containing protein [Lactobacillus gasseri]MCZ3762751.1 helix-turn-helix domain-containing protein [Lactobacillus gasseri]MCZ3766236.1 helix-turn-helix domain-containing protein [Lactobacillus gasseri]MCZ3768023.1 helix-turn-helix domain-containing protein [Lactobacillus gasseri]